MNARNEGTGRMDGTGRRPANGVMLRRAALGLVPVALLGLAACGHLMMMLHGSDVARPAESEFGLGPRSSVAGLYTAALDPGAPLRPRELRTVRVTVLNGNGAPVEGAAITVDGGMPQHNHGLPTRPRVTRSLGNGAYEIEGVRFNMGGWWELRLAIVAAAGADTVTFNLDL